MDVGAKSKYTSANIPKPNSLMDCALTAPRNSSRKKKSSLPLEACEKQSKDYNEKGGPASFTWLSPAGRVVVPL